MKRSNEWGGVLVSVLLFLPVLILCLGLVMDMGLLFVHRIQLAAAADFGALAAVQNVDLGRLATGERFIDPNDARRDARLWTEENLAAGLPLAVADRARVEVVVLNVPEGDYLIHPATGRMVVDPTVSVTVTAPVSLHFLRFLVPEVVLRVHADASVMSRP